MATLRLSAPVGTANAQSSSSGISGIPCKLSRRTRGGRNADGGSAGGLRWRSGIVMAQQQAEEGGGGGDAGGDDDFEARLARASWAMVHRHCYWRIKRSFSSRKVWLQQHIRGLSISLLRPESVTVPVSCATAPALEKFDKALSPTTEFESKERLLSTLVGNTTLVLTKDRHDTVLFDIDSTVDPGSVAAKREQSREYADCRKSNCGKKKWELYADRLSAEMEQKRMDCASSDSGQIRDLEEKMLLLESVDVDTAKVLALSPAIMSVSVETLRSVIFHLETSCGLRRADLGRILSMTPQILLVSVESHLRLAVKFLLEEVGLERTDLRKVIKRCPRLLVASVDCQMRPTMHFLESLGFHHMAALVSSNATLLTCGIQSRLLPKLEFLQSLGLMRDEAVSVALRFPAIFNYGVEQNLRPKYDYLTTIMGYNVNHLKSFPQYFGYSLDYRIRPRHEFLRSRNIRVPLPIFLKLSDDEFYRRFKGEPVRGIGVDHRECSARTAASVKFDVTVERLNLAASLVDSAQSDKDEVGNETLEALKQQSEAAAISSARHRVRTPVAVGV